MTNHPRRAWRRWPLRLVGPAIAVALLWRVDLREVSGSLRSVRFAPLALSLGLVAPLFYVKAWRWKTLLEACGRTLSLAEATRLYTIAAGAGALTPGAVGDFWKGLSPAVGGRAIGLWTSAIDRLYDVGALVLLGLVIASAWLPSDLSHAVALVALAGGVSLVWIVRRPLLELTASRLPRFPNAPTVLDATAVAALAATGVGLAVTFVRFELLVSALELPLAWRQSVVAFVLTSGVAALPFSVAGVGTRDLLLLAYLRQCGISSGDAIALSSLCLLLFVWNGVVAAGLWFAAPTERKPRSG